MTRQLVAFFGLFTSLGTLLCCALPALLVSLGLGAVMAGLAANVPGLVWLSENKFGLFCVAGAMLALNGILLWINRNAPCPIDPQLRDACIRGRRFSRKIFFVTVGIYSIGFFFAYIAPTLFS